MCTEFSQGQEPFLTTTDMEQLHIFIFILAVVHVVYSCLTMVLALLKVGTPPNFVAANFLVQFEPDS